MMDGEDGAETLQIFLMQKFLSLLLARPALRAPPEVAFAMRGWPLLLPSFSVSSSLEYFQSSNAYHYHCVVNVSESQSLLRVTKLDVIVCRLV